MEDLPITKDFFTLGVGYINPSGLAPFEKCAHTFTIWTDFKTFTYKFGRFIAPLEPRDPDQTWLTNV